MEKDIIPAKMIEDLDVNCCNEDCKWKGLLSSLTHHMLECEYSKGRGELSPQDPILISDEWSQEEKSDSSPSSIQEIQQPISAQQHDHVLYLIKFQKKKYLITKNPFFVQGAV